MSEHERATLAQIREGKGGRFFEVEADLYDIVEQIGLIDENLRVHWNDSGGFWQINEVGRDGKEYIVTTAQVLDQRLLTDLRRMLQPEWDPNTLRDRIDKEREKRIDDEAHEEIGQRAEVLAHAIRKDLNPGKIIVPRSPDAA